jgi:hypothetical protein
MQTNSTSKQSEKLTSKQSTAYCELKKILKDLKDDKEYFDLVARLIKAYFSENQLAIDLAEYELSAEYIRRYKKYSEVVQDYFKETHDKHLLVIKRLENRKVSDY